MADETNFQEDFSYESDDVVNVGYAQKFRQQINDNFERIFTESEKLRKEVANDIGEIITDNDGKVVSFQNQIGDIKFDDSDKVVSLQDQIGQTTMDNDDKVISLQTQISGNGEVIRANNTDKVVSLQEQIGQTQGASSGVVYSLQSQLGTTMGTANNPISIRDQLGTVTYADEDETRVYSIQSQIGKTYIKNGNLVTLQSQLGNTKIKDNSTNEPYSLQDQIASNNITKTKSDGTLISIQDQVGNTRVVNDKVVSLQEQIGQTTLRSDNYTPYSLQDQLGNNLVIDDLDSKDNIISIREQIGNITTYTSTETIEGIDEEDEIIVSKKVVSLQDQIGVVTDSNKAGNPNNSFKNLQEQIGEVTGIGNKTYGNHFYSLQSQIGSIKENANQTDVYPLQNQINDLKDYTDRLVEDLPEPMLFKGSLGIGGTITELPDASSINEGYVYKVITEGTYKGQAAKIGDLFISFNDSDDNTSPNYKWAYIPSADEPSGTVTSIKLEGEEIIEVDNEEAITESGVRKISHKTSGVTAGEYGKNVTATLQLGGKFKTTNVKIDKFGHITEAQDFEMTLPTTVDTQQQGDNSTKITNTAYVDAAKKVLQDQIGDTTGKDDIQTQINEIISSGSGGRVLGNRNFLSITDPKEDGEDVQPRDLWFEILPDEDDE